MESWKQAIWIAKFELNKSLKGILTLLFLLICFSVFFVTTLPGYLEKGFVGFDLFFLLAFGFGTFSGKTKEFQLQKVDENVWASPFFMMLNQLPISKDVLIKSRFVVNFSYSIPFYVLMLVLLYVFSPDLREALPFLSYCVFSVIWIGIGLNIGSAFPAAEAGDKITFQKSFLTFILLFIGLFAFLTGFTLWYENGFVGWTIMIAKEWPILSIVGSIIIAILGIGYAVRYMYKKMKQIDYLK